MREPYRKCYDTEGKQVREHVFVAEKALGRTLPDGAEVHHVDEDKANNSPNNLVICQDRAYHALLHYRTRALRACGNANWRRCIVCKTWDAPENLQTYCAVGKKKETRVYHRLCVNKYVYDRKHREITREKR